MKRKNGDHKLNISFFETNDKELKGVQQGDQLISQTLTTMADQDFPAAIGKKNESYDRLVLRLAHAALLCERDHRTKMEEV